MPTVVNLPLTDFTLFPSGNICMDKKQQWTGIRKNKKASGKRISKKKLFFECKTKDDSGSMESAQV